MAAGKYSYMIKYLAFILSFTMTLSITNAQSEQSGHYAVVNGLKMYYEIRGSGKPLVLIHGGGSTIESTFGRLLPEFSKAHQVIAVEMQAHGHTLDIDRTSSFEQDADDVAALLRQLKIEKADIMGFSNGGMDALQIAVRHPQLVRRLILASTPFRRAGMQAGFWEGLQHATLSNMPPPLKEAYLRANPDELGLRAMFDRDRTRMLAFKDFSDSDVQAIQAPTLVMDGDADVVRPEHALELSRTLPHAKLCILPGGHGEYIGDICFPNKNSNIPLLAAGIIEEFLKE